MTESAEGRQRREQKEADNAAKNAQVLFRVLALNGNTPSGQRITLKDAARRCRLTVTAVYWAAEHLASDDRQWVEIWPKPTGGVVEAIEYSVSNKDDNEVRITVAGVAHWKDEISMRFQTKQFDDVDRAIRRSKWGLGIAILGFAIALFTLCLKINEWLHIVQLPPAPSIEPASLNAPIGPGPQHLLTTNPSTSTSAAPTDTLSGTRSGAGRDSAAPGVGPTPKPAKKAPA